MKTRVSAVRGLLVVLLVSLAMLSAPRAAVPESKLVRYPHFHNGRVAFTYLGDIWTASENGQDVRRITVHRARDVYPRFSPDGKWIAFSSDRNGGMDVFIVPAEGGIPTQLTFHTADDTVLAWAPDSKSVLFASNRAEDFTGKLYTVGLEGGMPTNIGADMGTWASYSPDGSKLAINRHGQVYWRKYYRGANQTDVTIMDIASKSFTKITDFKGLDSWPMFARDGFVYFVSDREGGGLTNIWRVPEKGGQAEQVTTFKTGDVRWPSTSADTRTIVFEHGFGIWKLDVATRRATPIKLEIAAETQDNTSEVRSFRSEVDDFSLEPAGHRIAFSIHGEIFTAPVEEGDIEQLSDNPWRDQSPVYSPDGSRVAYISDASGREEVYLAAADGTGQPQKITDVDALKLSLAWSPDSKALAIVSSDNQLRHYNVETRQTKDLATSRYGNFSAPVWSPDGQWIAYSKASEVRSNDIYLVPSAGGTERQVTFDSYADQNPRFAPDGRKLYFLRSDGFGGGAGGGGLGGQRNIYAITLEREERDPEDPAERTDSLSNESGGGGGRQAAATPARTITIDWPGLERRTRQISRMPFAISSFVVAPDSRSLAFVTTEPAGTRTQPVIYTIQQDGRRLSRVLAGGTTENDDDDEDAPGGGGPGTGFQGLTFTRDGRTLYFSQGRGVYSIGVGGSGAGAATGREATRRRVTFTAQVRIDRPAEWKQMFGDAWRTMKYRFYDPKMHGHDWDAMKVKYEPLVQHVGDRQELLNIINEMIGELNASHTGAAPGSDGGRRTGTPSTGYLGVDLAADARAGRYRVTHIYKGGPSDKDWVKVSTGDYLIAIDGKPVNTGDEYWKLLNYRLNRKVDVTFNSKPVPEGAWVTRIAPVNQGGQNQLRYERCVADMRSRVDKLSNGRVGYLHIQAMNQPSLRKFEKELRENRSKQALVIDQRWNGGGNIDQELLGLLVQRQYQIWQPRGTEENARPFSGFFGPKVVLQNWRSASNAEMFPAGFRSLGLGKVIGTPTAGAVIGTGSYSLIDGSTVRTPGVGVFIADRSRTNMENLGVEPDILVENTPEDNLAGRDRQLETAVQELLKQLGATTTTSGSRQ
jgi:tricorn protease